MKKLSLPTILFFSKTGAIILILLPLVTGIGMINHATVKPDDSISNIDHAYWDLNYTILVFTDGTTKISSESLAYWAKKGLWKITGSEAINPSYSCYTRNPNGAVFVKTSKAHNLS